MSKVSSATDHPHPFGRFILACCLFFAPTILHAGTNNAVTLQWAPNPESHLAGYKVYHGTKSGIYRDSQKIGNTTTYRYTGLDSDKTHYFALTAYDALGNESRPSHEVSTTITDTESVLVIPLSGNGIIQSSPVGVSCSGTKCSGAFAQDTQVTLSAVPSNGYLFGGWGGPCSGTGSCSLTLAQSASVTATFTPIPVPDPPKIYNFPNGTTLTTSQVTFKWTAGSGVTDYWLYVGTVRGAKNLYDQSSGTSRTATISGLPLNGRSLFVRFWWKIAGAWLYADYTYQTKDDGKSSEIGDPPIPSEGNPLQILWHNPESGTLARWVMEGVTVQSVDFPGGTSVAWRVEKVGDLNGDGNPDLLWRNQDTGLLALWLMKGEQIVEKGLLGGVGKEWEIVGMGDVNHDTKADVIWRNRNNGLVAVWILNGVTRTSVEFLGSVHGNWKIEEVGDMNGDGMADLIWQNQMNGTVAISLLNGKEITSVTFPSSTAVDWKIQQIGDVNGDGNNDLVWQNTKNGMVGVWVMNGTTISSTGFPSGASPEWKIRQMGDFNQDGKADILFHHDRTGVVAVWLMDGLHRGSSRVIGRTSPDWEIQD